MSDAVPLVAAIAAVPGVRSVFPGVRVDAAVPARVRARIAVDRSAASGMVTTAVLEAVRIALAAPAILEIEVSLIE